MIVIISDDAGYADFGFMRNASAAADPGANGTVPTPNLDELASRGVIFTNAYTGAVCSPSRAMITTGLYGPRFGYAQNTDTTSAPIDQVAITDGLPTSIHTVWERMQGAGYSTSAIGKWHLGAHGDGVTQPGNRPENQGVEHFFGLWSGSRQYFLGSETGTERLRETVSDGAGAVTSNSVVESNYDGQYVTDTIGDRSAALVRDQAGAADPFFMYTSFTAPHTPLQATAGDLAFIDSLGEPAFEGDRRTYAAMQYAMDRNVGKILAALDDPDGDPATDDGVADNTLVVFLNDNGGSRKNGSDNGLLKKWKGSQNEGGLRVPMLIAGAGVDATQHGAVSSDLVHSIDILPTALIGAAGGALGAGEQIDGVNLLPYINGEVEGVAHENLLITRFTNQQSAVRMGEWKYMYDTKDGYQLYNLVTDLREANNVVGDPANAAVVADAHQLLVGYHVQMDKQRHDGGAHETNQFDRFLFREEGFTDASFSTADAWANADTGAGSFTATWRDGYAGNELVFRTKLSGDYTVTNDLTSVGGFAYMVGQVYLTSQAMPLTAAGAATIDGLPILMAKSPGGEGPAFHLDATDAIADAFTFDVALDVEVYDDLTIQGDGNQRFVFSGAVREFRDGRGVVKTGESHVTFVNAVEVTGVVDLRAGKTSFIDGRVGGGLVIRPDATVGVGGAGFNNGGGPTLLAVAGNYEQHGGSTLELDVLSRATHDRVDVADVASLGGLLHVTALPGFDAVTGDQYQVLAASGVSGEFDEASLPTLSADQMWQLHYSSESVSLRVTVAGDYNGDGAVDAADYTVWRDLQGQSVSALTRADGNGDGLVDQADYGVWASHFGQSVVFTSPEPQTVPEPGSMALLLGLAAFAYAARVRSATSGESDGPPRQS